MNTVIKTNKTQVRKFYETLTKTHKSNTMQLKSKHTNIKQ